MSIKNRKPTPFEPSRRAMIRVSNPLPIPKVCPHCGLAVKIVNNAEVYGESYGQWPYLYRCVSLACDSHVGLHPYTNLPLGTLARVETRKARGLAKQYFNPLWKNKILTRDGAYAWLAEKMGLPLLECHIGLFTTEQCMEVVGHCMARKDT